MKSSPLSSGQIIHVPSYNSLTCGDEETHLPWIYETGDAIPLWTWIGYPKVSLHQLLLQGDACPLHHFDIQPQPLLLVDHLGHILLFGVFVCHVGHKVEYKKYFY